LAWTGLPWATGTVGSSRNPCLACHRAWTCRLHYVAGGADLAGGDRFIWRAPMLQWRPTSASNKRATDWPGLHWPRDDGNLLQRGEGPPLNETKRASVPWARAARTSAQLHQGIPPASSSSRPTCESVGQPQDHGRGQYINTYLARAEWFRWPARRRLTDRAGGAALPSLNERRPEDHRPVQSRAVIAARPATPHRRRSR
jgi:hypothetical protein